MAGTDAHGAAFGEAALTRLASGGFVVMAGAPAGTVVGIDTASWAVTEGFTGFKLIPPGVHFVSFGWVGCGNCFLPGPHSALPCLLPAESQRIQAG